MQANQAIALAVLIGLGLSVGAFAQSSDPKDENTSSDPAMTGKVPPPPPPEMPMTPASPEVPKPSPKPPTTPVPPETAMAPMPPQPQPPPPTMENGGVTGTATARTSAGPAAVISHRGMIDATSYKIDFDAMDRNHDGSISRAEARGNANLVREFHVVDANHNGRLSKQELKNWL